MNKLFIIVASFGEWEDYGEITMYATTNKEVVAGTLDEIKNELERGFRTGIIDPNAEPVINKVLSLGKVGAYLTIYSMALNDYTNTTEMVGRVGIVQ